MAAESEVVKLVDDGWLTIEIDGVSQRLDVFQTYNTIMDLTKSTTGEKAFLDKVQEVMTSAGYPAGSHRLADVFSKAVFDRVAALQGPVEPDTDADPQPAGDAAAA